MAEGACRSRQSAEGGDHIQGKLPLRTAHAR
jgi:hypothetical protein